MIYQFDEFELDLTAGELRAQGDVRKLEPQVFKLLALLAENRDRLVSRDEIVEKVWDGRIVSDAAISSRVKSARRALDDDGRSQRIIKTIHRRGFRFVAAVSLREARQAQPLERAGGALAGRDAAGSKALPESLHRPSLAVLPFRRVGGPGRYAAMATALPDELISELARLRWLLVTARGSSFRISAENGDYPTIGRLLGVRYCVSGSVECSDRRLAVVVELLDAESGAVVWAERFAGKVDDVHVMREEIRARVLTALDLEIPLHEAGLARLAVPGDLDAWSAYHLGLQHVYRFNRADGAAAARLFERAVELEPAFARAHAGLSFVHFQSAFMRYSDDRAGEIRKARQHAERGLELDPLDPFVNFTMGRSFWLEGDLESGSAWLERAICISPNYAQGLYALGWTEALAAHATQARTHVDLAMRLSPIDPLYYGMMGTRAFVHMVKGEDAEAAQWAERAARSPGAHVLIAMIAAAAQWLNGDAQRAASWADQVRRRNPSLDCEDFLRAFPMKSQPLRTRVAQALGRLGF
jgi:TolB-like protein/tetratricopeptide (TPR) repeat protein